MLQHFKKKFYYLPELQRVMDKDNHTVAQIRGWGHLTGNGCQLSTEEAAKLQDKFGRDLAKWCNEYSNKAKSSQIKEVLLDMDGVLCNFWEAAIVAVCSELGISSRKAFTSWEYGNYSIEGHFQISRNKFWNIIHDRGESFWSGLQPCIAWKQLLFYLDARNVKLKICTKHSNHSACLAGKAAWIQAHLPIRLDDCHFTHEKERLATPHTLLIDDLEANCQKFSEAGGSAICVPSDWSRADLRVVDVMKPVEEFFNGNGMLL